MIVVWNEDGSGKGDECRCCAADRTTLEGKREVGREVGGVLTYAWQVRVPQCAVVMFYVVCKQKGVSCWRRCLRSSDVLVVAESRFRFRAAEVQGNSLSHTEGEELNLALGAPLTNHS